MASWADWFAWDFYQRSLGVEFQHGSVVLFASGEQPNLGGLHTRTSLPFPMDVAAAKRLRDQLSEAIEAAESSQASAA